MKVIVYSQPNCPPCNMLKSFLKNKGVEFEDKNIKEDKQAYDELINLKFTSTPVTVIDGKKSIAGFNVESLEKELNLE